MRLNLPEFVFISSKELNDIEFIMHTYYPCLLARAYKFEQTKAMENFVIKHNIFQKSFVCENFNILVCLHGSIEQATTEPIKGHLIHANELSILHNALKFYEKERIKGNESRLKKFAK